MKGRCKGKTSDVTLKIDISKAYNRVDWRCLEGVLRVMGFSKKWANWMHLCVQTISYSLVNEEVVGRLFQVVASARVIHSHHTSSSYVLRDFRFYYDVRIVEVIFMEPVSIGEPCMSLTSSDRKSVV